MSDTDNNVDSVIPVGIEGAENIGDVFNDHSSSNIVKTGIQNHQLERVIWKESGNILQRMHNDLADDYKKYYEEAVNSPDGGEYLPIAKQSKLLSIEDVKLPVNKLFKIPKNMEIRLGIAKIKQSDIEKSMGYKEYERSTYLSFKVRF
jgi:hypothetical protein